MFIFTKVRSGELWSQDQISLIESLYIAHDITVYLLRQTLLDVCLVAYCKTNKKANKTSSVPLMLYFTFDDGTKKVKFLFYFIMVYGKKEY